MAIKTNKALAEESMSKGIRLSQSENPKEAIVHFDNAIRLKPSSSRAYYSRAVAYQKLRKRKQAFDDYSIAQDLAEKDGTQTLSLK